LKAGFNPMSFQPFLSKNLRIIVDNNGNTSQIPIPKVSPAGWFGIFLSRNTPSQPHEKATIIKMPIFLKVLFMVPLSLVTLKQYFPNHTKHGRASPLHYRFFFSTLGLFPAPTGQRTVAMTERGRC
jgi:hypothetical protein